MDHSRHGTPRGAPSRRDTSGQGWVGRPESLPPPGAPLDGAPEDCTRWLAQTIETEIIPRLMLAHQDVRRDSVVLEFPRPSHATTRPRDDDVAELARRVLGRDPQDGIDFVRRMRLSGVALDVIYLDLLARTARYLGELWEADLCPFADVTIGLWRLQQVMHDLGRSAESECEYDGPVRRAILVPVPGSQHTMGLFMVAEFFRRAGWDVWGDAAVSANEIIAAAHARWFDLIGISIGSEVHVEQLSSVILDVRKASRNPALTVIVGGPIIVSNPELVARVGADGTADDAARAVEQAEIMVAKRAARA
jgi:methanogenic corrinoid protein MtbC1